MKSESVKQTKRIGTLYMDATVWDKLEEVTKDSPVWNKSTLAETLLRDGLKMEPKPDKAMDLIRGQ